MGQAARAREAKAKYERSIPRRCLKAVLGFALIYLLFPFVFARICYKRDEWPWDELGSG